MAKFERKMERKDKKISVTKKGITKSKTLKRKWKRRSEMLFSISAFPNIKFSNSFYRCLWNFSVLKFFRLNAKCNHKWWSISRILEGSWLTNFLAFYVRHCTQYEVRKSIWKIRLSRFFKDLFKFICGILHRYFRALIFQIFRTRRKPNSLKNF